MLFAHLCTFSYFSSPEPKANEELIVLYSSRCPSVCLFTFSKVFSEAAWPTNAKFYIKYQKEGGINVYINNNRGHMTKMAIITIYGKTEPKFQNFQFIQFFSGTGGPISFVLCFGVEFLVPFESYVRFHIFFFYIISSGKRVAAYWEIDAHSAYNMFSKYMYPIVNLGFPTSVFGVGISFWLRLFLIIAYLYLFRKKEL